MNNSRVANGDRNIERPNSNQGRDRNQFNGLNSGKRGETKGSIDMQSRRRAFNPVPYTKEESENIQQLLDKVLGPEYVSFRPGGGGQSVSYIEGWKALNLANEIFGFNGWSSELISSQVDYFDTHGNSGRYSMGLSVVVRITIKDGTYHEDFGYGYIDNAKSKAMAFEKCRKEAFTDGLKRCLRCFGNVLGNCLYDRTIISKIQKVKLPPVQLESDHFHRDPLLIKRENQKRQTTSVNILETKREFTESSDTSTRVSENTTTPSNKNTVTDHPNHMAKPQGTPSLLPKSKTKSAGTSKNMEIVGDFDDSFVFSDDLLADDDLDMVTDGIDDYDMEMIMAEESRKSENAKLGSKSVEPEPINNKETTNITENQTNGPEIMNAPPIFVSAKRADFLQETPEAASKVPQFDTKFISPSMRRTLDPNKSVPIKRSDVQSLVDGNAPKSTKLLSKNSMINKPSITTTNTVGKRLVGLPPSQKPPIKRLHRDISPSQISKTDKELLRDKENQV